MGVAIMSDEQMPAGEIVASLRRIEYFLALLVKLEQAPVLVAELKDDRLRRLYDMTGEQTREQIASAIDLSAGTVSGTWARWEQLGLLVKDGSRYRKSVQPPQEASHGKK